MTSTTVIWFIVRVPVLSELIAEVKPSVSTDGSSLTIALRLARSTPPRDRIIWVTVGSASGTAAMARATALTKSTSHASPRVRPRANITIIVRPAAAAIQRVSRSSSAVRGVFSLPFAESIAEILPSSVSAPVAVTIMVPLPCVTGVFMKAMSDWSPGPSPEPSRVSASLAAGTLSPVSRLVDLQGAGRDDATVGRHLVAGGEQDDVADDELLGRDLGRLAVPADPCRRLQHRPQRVHRALGLALLPQPDDRVQDGEHEEEDRGAPFGDQCRDHRGGHQDDLHVAAVLLGEPQPARPRLLLGERVRTVRAQPLRHGGCRQPGVRVDCERLHDVVG